MFLLFLNIHIFILSYFKIRQKSTKDNFVTIFNEKNSTINCFAFLIINKSYL